MKSEPRLSSLRKSLKRRSKKENHHELTLKQGAKEKKIQKAGSVLQVFERSNWMESLQSLNSSSLEQAFLPEVVKQKKEQRELQTEFVSHKNSLKLLDSNSDLDQDSSKMGKKKVCSISNLSQCGNESKQKPPVPSKKRKMSHTCHDENTGVVERMEISAEKLFSWVISPVKSEQFFRFVLYVITSQTVPQIYFRFVISV